MIFIKLLRCSNCRNIIGCLSGQRRFYCLGCPSAPCLGECCIANPDSEVEYIWCKDCYLQPKKESER